MSARCPEPTLHAEPVPESFFVSHPTTASVVHYDDEVVRRFALTTVLWGLVGMTVGVLIAALRMAREMAV